MGPLLVPPLRFPVTLNVTVSPGRNPPTLEMVAPGVRCATGVLFTAMTTLVTAGFGVGVMVSVAACAWTLKAPFGRSAARTLDWGGSCNTAMALRKPRSPIIAKSQDRAGRWSTCLSIWRSGADRQLYGKSTYGLLVGGNEHV